ncbi:MAG: lipopolysaccharide biosynthesis, partial [Candidatus Solibacter sp.]|nr:lipopolysaccharide biosynthesis [Candidatus Solibacter sp.]
MRKNVTIQTVGTSTFQISFSYPEAVKAQAVVREFVSQFTTENIRTPVRLTQHGNVGSYLEVLDPASLPQAPASPNRAAVAAVGVAFGLMLGALTLRL